MTAPLLDTGHIWTDPQQHHLQREQDQRGPMLRPAAPEWPLATWGKRDHPRPLGTMPMSVTLLWVTAAPQGHHALTGVAGLQMFLEVGPQASLESSLSDCFPLF